MKEKLSTFILGVVATILAVLIFGGITATKIDMQSEANRCRQWGGYFMIDYMTETSGQDEGYRFYCWRKEKLEILFDYQIKK